MRDVRSIAVAGANVNPSRPVWQVMRGDVDVIPAGLKVAGKVIDRMPVMFFQAGIPGKADSLEMLKKPAGIPEMARQVIVIRTVSGGRGPADRGKAGYRQ